MSGKQLALLAVSVVILLIAIVTLIKGCNKGKPTEPQLATQYLECAGCGERQGVTSREVWKMDHSQAIRDDEGGLLLPCPQCGEVKAKLIIEDPYTGPEEESDEEE